MIKYCWKKLKQFPRYHIQQFLSFEKVVKYVFWIILSFHKNWSYFPENNAPVRSWLIKSFSACNIVRAKLDSFPFSFILYLCKFLHKTSLCNKLNLHYLISLLRHKQVCLMMLCLKRYFPSSGNINDYVKCIYRIYANLDGNNRTCGRGWEEVSQFG